jgi:dipeptidyl aminopeptidase/acylaminoacyl peptidase
MPRRFLPAFVLLAAVSLALADGPDDRRPTDPHSISSPASSTARPIPIEDLFYTRNVGGGFWSPDGRQVVFSLDMTGNQNVWRVNADGSGLTQMLYSRDTQSAARYSRDGRSIFYRQDAGGNEMWQLMGIPADGGEAQNYLNQPGQAAAEDFLFSPDGKTLAIVYKTKTGSTYDIAVIDPASHQLRNVTNEKTPGFLWSLAAWLPDSQHLLVQRTNSAFTDASIYLLDIATGKSEPLTQHDKEALFVATSVSPNGRTALIQSNVKSGATNVALLDIASKKLTWITDTGWEASSGFFSPDGKLFTYELNKDGVNDVFLCDSASNKCNRLNLEPGLTSEQGPLPWSPDGTRLLISHQSSRRAGDLWTYDVRTNKATQLTFSALASLNPESIPEAQVVHYKSFDGKMISALLWMPPNLKRDGSNPAIVLPHGGPTGQTTDYFNTDAAALASRGFICIAPNPRGSTGFGIEFQKANYQDLGGGDLKDEVAGRQFLIDTGFVDAKKVGIEGGSYGGFMTLMAIGKTPDLWAAAVAEYGIIDWYTMLQHSDPFLQEYEKSLLGDPVKDKAVYENASPIKFIRNATAPLLVEQGDNDIRVPKEEAEQVVNILKQAGKTVDAVYYPEEGHGFRKRENNIDAQRREVEWFEKYLKATQ